MGDTSSFMFTVSLAAVINGLGIVRLLSALAEYLRQRRKVQITHFWVYSLLLLFQFLLHVLLWWSMWGVRGLAPFNFLSYLYLLIGPILMFLATSLLLPDIGGDHVDLRKQYMTLARPYFTVMAIAWLWSIGFWPVLIGLLSPAVSLNLAYCVAAVVLCLTTSERLHAVLVVAHYIALGIYVSLYSYELGGVGKTLLEGLQR